MGAVVNVNETLQKQKFPSGKLRKTPQNHIFGSNHPPSLLTMRPRLRPPGHLLPPRMGPPAPGMRPPLPFRGAPQLRPPLPPPNIMRGLRPNGLPPPGIRAPLPPPPGMPPHFGLNHRPHPHMRFPMPPPLMRPQRHIRPIMHDKRRIQQGKITKRKRLPFTNETDLNKPWVNDQVKAEFAKKEELLKIAKNTSQATDWAAYRGQRDKCNDVYAAAKLEYIGQHPEEVRIQQLLPQVFDASILTASIDYTADVVL